MGATSHFVVEKTDHPGSSQKEIEKEPNWGSGHNHRIGFKNRDNRVPGYIAEAKGKLSAFHHRVDNGDLVNFEDIVNAQENLSLRHPDNRSVGWRYVLDMTEDWVKYGQKWPANLEAEKKKEMEENKKNDPDAQAKRNTHPTTPPDTPVENSHLKGESDKDKQNPEDKYSPQELALLRALKHESEYMKNLEANDGKRESPQKSHKQQVSIDEADQFTPDNWLPRSQDLIRLTGKHPLNAEPHLTKLFDAGLVTPNELHYVRNHGPVPRLLWEFHEVDVEHGALVLSMDQLKNDFEAINIPVFLACDGMRRKELNLIRQSKGFNWGSGAGSCAYWKGPHLRDILLAAGVPEQLKEGQRYWVNFEGADELSEGKYATSIPFDYAMDAMNDVILAYEMNDVPLPPDHGYPVRVIIPGYVGGRNVKWLKRIWISEKENDSHYHIWDNRVLPSFITDMESELAETMFRHPSTACNEQNLNSVIVRPEQGERISLADAHKHKTYQIQGYAYDGGGHEVQKVEVSLDNGENWLYCIREFPEAPIRHGKKFWTWLHWHVDVPISHLIQARDIKVRCFNVFKNSQPKKPAWNLMGMMNNCWYTVKSEIVDDAKTDDTYVLFRHPTEPGTGNGGWMKPSVVNQVEAAKRDSGTPQKQFTREEIEKHDKEDDCWIVVDGKVYDATSVMAWHPGGKAPMMAHAGRVHQETTEEFDSIHDGLAFEKLQQCLLGVVTDKARNFIKKNAEKQAAEKAMGNGNEKRALQKHQWIPTKLIDRKALSDDTFSYTFQLPDHQAVLGLGTCQHVFIGFHLRDKMLVRSYTPTRPIMPAPKDAPSEVTADGGKVNHTHGPKDGDGTFELVVKTYFPDERQPGGAMSNILHKMPVGGEVEIRGPTGEITYEGNGKFIIDGEERMYKHVSLVLGGSGVTPGYSLIARIVAAGDDKTEVRVVDANKTEKDILLRDELDGFAEKSVGRLKITHVLSHPDDGWDGRRGHVDEEILKESLFPPSGDSVVFLCGPPTMIKVAVLPALKDWGYEEDKNVFGF
ncbi:nitrate reductase [NADH] 1 [Colletotrichum spaethianum]|uniref:Nitrate reductase [NADPH] n=1 Tax=Colletotrichum spaethianum TaxID=700344 RepID=A0AA37L6N7_9PEZI|nr:nitrate reductase [NADH] 1 [Colletotrichum spaethianum]GKT41145.1 nitrate reductase [NADH] 1 [Colletotrichum spaethianum]